MTDAFAFLAARRSVPAKLLLPPAPDAAALGPILAAALRVPDHGKLEPWRLLVIERAAAGRLAGEIARRMAAAGQDPEAVAKAEASWAGAPLIVAVIAVPRESPKIPAIEQVLSAGALCAHLVNALLAAGWGACWLTGWAAYDRGFAEQALGLAPAEWVAGFVHVGTAPASLPPDRPRPDPARLVTRLTD